MDRTTRDIIVKAQAGDTESFHEIVAKYDTRIMTLILQIAQNKEDSEDIYQETFVKVYKNISKFRFESDIYTWIYRIAVNTTYNYKKTQMTPETMFVNVGIILAIGVVVLIGWSISQMFT